MEGQVEGNFQSIQLIRTGEVDGVEPASERGQAVVDHVARKVARGGVLEVWHEAPHRGGGRLQLCREGGVVGVGLKLNVGLHLARIHVHALEHGQEVEPHEELFLVLHELVGDGGMGENIVQVGHQRPIAVVLMYQAVWSTI